VEHKERERERERKRERIENINLFCLYEFKNIISFDGGSIDIEKHIFS